MFRNLKKVTQLYRFGVQIIAMGFTVAGYNYLVDINALPGHVFVASVVLAGMFFCGWVCPFGAAQEWLRFLGRLTGVNMNIPNPAHRYLSLIRYVLWLLFLLMAVHTTDLSINSRVAFLGELCQRICRKLLFNTLNIRQ
ncbi:hypothetical protein FACS1894187_23200 [Synergistales bacterium]|nr:hypothetical protein FACS1894187_23200 [Synergistales bacterium]